MSEQNQPRPSKGNGKHADEQPKTTDEEADVARKWADQAYPDKAKEAGGEESKHGRKQKGNVDDT